MRPHRVVFSRESHWRAGLGLGVRIDDTLSTSPTLVVRERHPISAAFPAVPGPCGEILVPSDGRGVTAFGRHAPAGTGAIMRASDRGTWRLDPRLGVLRELLPSGQIAREQPLASSAGAAKDFDVRGDTLVVLLEDQLLVTSLRAGAPRVVSVPGASAVALTAEAVFLAAPHGLMRLDLDGCVLARRVACDPTTAPLRLAAWCGGLIGLVRDRDDGDLRLVRFASDGSRLGEQVVEPRAEGDAFLGASESGRVVVSTSRWLHVLDPTRAAEGNPFVTRFITRALDHGGQTGERWHRIDVRARVPDGAAVVVRYVTGNDPHERAAVDAAIDATDEPVEQRMTRLERLLPPTRWTEDRFLATTDQTTRSLEVLLQTPPPAPGEPTPRVLWSELRLVTSGSAPPVVERMTIEHPRDSYLRHLPAHYRRPEAGAHLTERFLSIFESLLEELGDAVADAWRCFDPRTVPADCFDWLASWLDLVVDEVWTLEQKRALLGRAFDLYRRKGTMGALQDALDIVLDGATAVEGAALGRRMVVSADAEPSDPLRLGHGMLLVGREPASRPGWRPPASMLLGVGATVGSLELALPPVDPHAAFHVHAHRVSVFVPLDGDELRRRRDAVLRLVEALVPAHVLIDLRVVPPATRLVCGAYLGFSARMAERRPARLGDGDVTVGGSVLASSATRGPTVGRERLAPATRMGTSRRQENRR